MSEPVDAKLDAAAKSDGDAGKRTVAQVEKWMAMIREMSAEESEAIKLPAAHNLALPVTE
jgi:hypothetical protein